MRNYQSIDENNEAYVTTLALGKNYVAVVQLIISCSQQASYLPHLPNIKVSHTLPQIINQYLYNKKGCGPSHFHGIKVKKFQRSNIFGKNTNYTVFTNKNKTIRLWPSRQCSSTKQAGPAAMFLSISCSNRLLQPCKISFLQFKMVQSYDWAINWGLLATEIFWYLRFYIVGSVTILNHSSFVQYINKNMS